MKLKEIELQDLDFTQLDTILSFIAEEHPSANQEGLDYLVKEFSSMYSISLTESKDIISKHGAIKLNKLITYNLNHN